MKKLFAILLCLLLLGTMMLPALATEATDPTQPTETPAPVPEAPHIMAIFCAVVAVAGGIYLFIGMKKSGRF